LRDNYNDYRPADVVAFKENSVDGVGVLAEAAGSGFFPNKDPPKRPPPPRLLVLFVGAAVFSVGLGVVPKMPPGSGGTSCKHKHEHEAGG